MMACEGVYRRGKGGEGRLERVENGSGGERELLMGRRGEFKVEENRKGMMCG